MSVIRIYTCALIALFCGGSAVAGATPVTVHTSVDREQIMIGDPIRYTVEVEAPSDTEVEIPLLEEHIGAFQIIDLDEIPARTTADTETHGRWYTLTIFDVGTHQIPPVSVFYRDADGTRTEVQGQGISIEVKSLLASADAADDIRDVKPPEPAPFDPVPYYLVAAAVVIVLFVAVVLYYVLNRPRRQRQVPSRPAHEVALAALSRLRTQRLVESGRLEEYYINLSRIVRQYLEDGFHVRAPEMTTEEFLNAAAADQRLAATHRRMLAEFLAQADLVKFARHVPEQRESADAYDAARRFVEDTQPSPSTTPHSTEVPDAAA